jgi:hypothetical protein
VDASVKAGLLTLVGQAADQGGWSARRACRLLGLDHWRAARWQARRSAGCLDDRPPGGHPLHRLLTWERAAVVELFEAWGEIDRSHRKLAHRGSRIGLVHIQRAPDEIGQHPGVPARRRHRPAGWPAAHPRTRPGSRPYPGTCRASGRTWRRSPAPGELDAELDRVRAEYNGVRLHAAIGYVTPGDEHEGRGDAIRQQRRDGLAAARLARIDYRRNTPPKQNQ